VNLTGHLGRSGQQHYWFGAIGSEPRCSKFREAQNMAIDPTEDPSIDPGRDFVTRDGQLGDLEPRFEMMI
jgi:hypothetical protein